MRPRIVVLSGPVASGKSELAQALAVKFGADHVSTRELMNAHARNDNVILLQERQALQQYGEDLDRRTDGRWVADALAAKHERLGLDGLIVVDSIRIPNQLRHIHEAFGRDVVHVHLTAPVGVLADRYVSRGDASGIAELGSYTQVQADPTESGVEELGTEADVVIDTYRSAPGDVVTRCAARVGLLPRGCEQLVDLLVGGQYGSEGKGNIAFFLAPEYDILVRVGGPNAGHKVPLGEGFTHRSLPSGTRANERARIVIGPGAVLDLDVLLREIADSRVESDRLAIDPNAIIIEAWDRELEQGIVARIGSTGKGVGAATARRILNRGGQLDRFGDMPAVRRAADMPELRPYLRPSGEVLDEAYRAGQKILLEGTQGTALSLLHGPYPHVTSRDTTSSGCLAEAGIGPRRVRKVIGVFRTYPIRVQDGTDGTSGPMSAQITFGEIADRSGLDRGELEQMEKGSVSGKPRRVAEFDWALLRRSSELNSLTDIALTFADYIDASNRSARRFDQLTSATMRFVEETEHVAGVPVSLIATRFAARSIIDRRDWH